MRRCPEWFQKKLTEVGGLNPYGQPIFLMQWSTEPRAVYGGRWPDGYEGYKQVPMFRGPQCWCLLIWEPRELMGTPDRWEWDFRDSETGFNEVGRFPSRGRYRLLKQFIHTEVVQNEEWKQMWVKGVLEPVKVRSKETIVTRMEPNMFILYVMLPMLKMWRQLTDQAKTEALRQEEELKEAEVMKMVADKKRDCKINRSSKLVQKRVEIIERGMAEAMRIAAKSGRGMQTRAI